MALNADRNTPTRDGKTVSHPVAAAKKIYAGALVVLNASGYAEPGSTSATLTAAGRRLPGARRARPLDGGQSASGGGRIRRLCRRQAHTRGL